MIDVESIFQDPRFHPMVDQLALGETQSVDVGVNSTVGSRLGLNGKQPFDSKTCQVGLMSMPLLSGDGTLLSGLSDSKP